MTASASNGHRPRRSLLFRTVNERIAVLAPGLGDTPRLFVCECDRYDCADAVELTLAEFSTLRDLAARFVVALGHELDGTVVQRNERWSVVEISTDDSPPARVDREPR
jgi:hypothetical protein